VSEPAPKTGVSTLTMTIDGREVTAEAGQTILEAATAKGIGIPTLCDHPTGEAYGACRMCLVEIAVHGRRRLVTSCNYEAAEGLVVETNSDRVRRSRRMTIELLLARCPEVPALQRLAKAYKVEAPRFPKEGDDCILCGLCVRVCRERMGVGAADFVGRGAEMRVDTPYERKSEACITCGACTFVCPTGSKRLDKVFPHKLVPRLSEFDMGMRPRSTVYIPFPQALPNVPVIDRENCVRFRNGACGTCAEVCPPKAIDYEQKDEVVRVETGAVILAPGFCPYAPAGKPEYSYGLAPNVLSSLQFERLLSASGPCMGNVVRPSDGKVPKRIAFVQCVGSRDETQPWCSSVCCMYSLKEAIIAKEHEHEVECTLFYIDIRAHGKGFDAYYERAKDLGIRFVRCRPSRIDELPSKSLRVGFVPEDGDGGGAGAGTAGAGTAGAGAAPDAGAPRGSAVALGAYRSEDFDLVVLASGLEPPAEARAMAAKFGISLDPNRFGASAAFNPVASSRPGVYLAGPFSEPKDIPETVVEASSAAAEAMTLLAEARGTLVTKVELPPETDIAGQEPRIGVFVCHCGKNIGAYVDVPAVREYAKTLPYVAFAMDNLYTCSSDPQVIIKSKIAEHRLNRVVVASCSPRTHEPLFQQTIREQGLNVHLFEMANIRDQCSWVHMDRKREATEKSKDLVRMAVAKARLTEPLHARTLPVTRAALVVGGGAAGMSAALSLADQGYETFLVEKSGRLGGVAAGIERNLAGHGVAAHVAGLASRVIAHPKVRVFTDAHLERVDGFVGNFETTIAQNASNGVRGIAREPVKVKHGAVVLAVGAAESRPAEYRYGEHPAVVTLLELEKRLAGRNATGLAAPGGTVVFIQCVGSREGDHLYCSRTCCAAAIKQAIRIKESSPSTNVLVLYRDIRTYGFRETAYERARELGVAFIRYDLDRKPHIEPRGKDGVDGVTVTVRDPILGADLAIPADLLVLSARVDANPDNERLSQLFKVPLNANGFFLEAHAKLRPVDFATEGVFVCGSAHYPKDTTEAISQAKAAAARAATVLARESIEAEGKVSYVRESRCEACGACVEVCPYHAVEIDLERNKAKVNEALCKGCGACAAPCRSSAIDLKGFRDEQIMAVLKTVGTIG